MLIAISRTIGMDNTQSHNAYTNAQINPPPIKTKGARNIFFITLPNPFARMRFTSVANAPNILRYIIV